MRINKHDTNGTKPLLGKGELGYDDYVAGGDVGRVYVGTGSENIALAEKSEVDSHVNRVDNPHSVTKAQVGLGNVDNTADANKNVLSATKWATARTITLSGDVAGSASVDGSANVTITTTVQPDSVALGTDTTGNYVAGATAGTGISISGTAGEGWSPTITNTAPNVTTDISISTSATSVTVNSSDGADGTIPSATTIAAGVMSAADKTKLDGIAPGATTNTGTVTSVATSGAITGGTITTSGTISHSTADGYLHVPATGTTNNGKVLTAGATAGSLSWTTLPTAPVTSVAGKTGAVTLVKGDVGLGNVDNIADASKSVLSATKLTTARTISLTGDVTGSVSFDGSADASISATIAANSVALGTDTTGNYVAGVTQGTGISVTGTAGEGWTPVVSLTNVGTAGTYRSVTTDAQGRVTAGTNPTTLSGYGITDAQTASRTSATFTTAANTWYRIATSVVGIERNSAEFVVDWAVSGNHGSTRFAAACHYGESAGVSLMQTNYAKYGIGGITEARIVYHTTFTGNYAYVEVKFAAALTSVAVNVEMQDPLGWTLVTPSTAGSIPSGYTSYVHTFVPGAAITAGTYPKVTINQEGRVISGSAMLASDVPDLDASKITSGTLPVVRGGTGVTTSTGTGSVVLSTSPTLTTPNIGVASGTSFNSITGLASVAPIVAGTAAVGTSTLTARQDHVHPAQTTITGNAGTATTLQTARTIGASGDVTGTATSFNGSANITIPMTLANSGVTAGTYSKVTVDAKGRVTAGAAQTMEDIPDATFKRSVRCATTANITLSGTQTIDGIAVVASDRVLVKNQTTSSQNGIYVVNASTWTRSLDADSASKIASALVAVDSGTVNGGKLFDNDFKTTDTLGTTAMTWSMNLDDGSLLTAGSTSVGIVKYNGTTAVSGQFDGGNTTPTGTTRLNFGGYFYPTYVNLIGSADTATASSHVFVETASDGYVRPKTLANFKSEIFNSPALVTPNIGVATGTSFNSITGLSATTPLMNGTAAVGTGVTVARADHVHPTDTTKVTKVASTDNAVVRFDGATGDVQNSLIGVDDLGNIGSGTQSFNGFGGTGFKNYIINGNFGVWQRGTSATGFGGLGGVPYYTADRFALYTPTAGKYWNWSKSTDVPDSSFKFSLLYGATTADFTSYITQRVENVSTLSGKTVKVSFYAKATSAITTSNIVLQQNFGSGGSALIDMTSQDAIKNASLTTNWQRFNFTFVLPSISGKTIGVSNYLEFSFGISNSTVGVYICGLQIEEGSVATPFEQRPYGLELGLCQRYYRAWRYIGGAQNISTTQLQFTIDQISYMRTQPTLTNPASGSGSGSIFSTFGSSTSEQYFGANCCVTSGEGIITANVTGLIAGVSSISIVGTASAEL